MLFKELTLASYFLGALHVLLHWISTTTHFTGKEIEAWQWEITYSDLLLTES